MNAGRLKHRIEIVELAATLNSYNEDVITETTVGTFWCTVEALQGRELDTAHQRWAEARYKITMRKQPGITFQRKMRGTWNERTLDIVDVQDVGGSMRPEVVMIARDYEG